uniref:Uncharacterized protein n=1 Tax=Rhizophora mucronata TaxID=61149 RepID=A0A2P2IV92_RHIMU
MAFAVVVEVNYTFQCRKKWLLSKQEINKLQVPLLASQKWYLNGIEKSKSMQKRILLCGLLISPYMVVLASGLFTDGQNFAGLKIECEPFIKACVKRESVLTLPHQTKAPCHLLHQLKRFHHLLHHLKRLHLLTRLLNSYLPKSDFSNEICLSFN